MAEEPAAERAYQEADGKEGRRIELLDDRVVRGKEGAGEIEGEGSEGIKIVPFDEIADGPDEDRLQPAAHIREIELAGAAWRPIVVRKASHRFLPLELNSYEIRSLE